MVAFLPHESRQLCCANVVRWTLSMQGKAKYIIGKVKSFKGKKVELESGEQLHADILVTACMVSSNLPCSSQIRPSCRIGHICALQFMFQENSGQHLPPPQHSYLEARLCRAVGHELQKQPAFMSELGVGTTTALIRSSQFVSEWP